MMFCCLCIETEATPRKQEGAEQTFLKSLQATIENLFNFMAEVLGMNRRDVCC